MSGTCCTCVSSCFTHAFGAMAAAEHLPCGLCTAKHSRCRGVKRFASTPSHTRQTPQAATRSTAHGERARIRQVRATLRLDTKALVRPLRRTRPCGQTPGYSPDAGIEVAVPDHRRPGRRRRRGVGLHHPRVRLHLPDVLERALTVSVPNPRASLVLISGCLGCRMTDLNTVPVTSVC